MMDILKVCEQFGCNDDIYNIMCDPKIPDTDIFFFIKSKHKDLLEHGNLVPHVAAAFGRIELLERVISEKNCINNKDPLFGGTPLHYSFLYKQILCSVRLIQWGCNLEIFDATGRLAFDVDSEDEDDGDDDRMGFGTPFVWGCNTNYTLGLPSHRDVETPEPIDSFTKENILVVKVAMGKYHTVFITLSGVYTCGMGLCVGYKSESLVPWKIPLDEIICDVSIGELHTLFITDTGYVFTCGKNTFNSLGYSDDPLLVSKARRLQIDRNSPASLICAGPRHSVISMKSQLFTFGENIGQLGHREDVGAIVTKPMSVFRETDTEIPEKEILAISACSNATVFLTQFDVFILSDHKRKKLQLPSFDSSARKRLDVFSADQNNIRLVIGHFSCFYLWTSNAPSFFKCIYAPWGRIVTLKLIPTGCVFLVENGRGYFGSFGHRDDVKQTQCVEAQRIAHVKNATSVWPDPQGRNFCILQRGLITWRKKITEFSIDKPWAKVRQDLCRMFEQASEDDLLHDIIIKARGETIAAHSCVIFHPLINTNDLVGEKNSENIYNVDSDPESFRQLLRFFYNPKYGITINNDAKVAEKLEKMKYQAINAVAEGINPTDGDLVLISEDNVKFRVHKFVLASRMEYFSIMFSSTWSHKPQKELKVHIDSTVLKSFIDVMYTGTSSVFEASAGWDVLVSAMKKADEFLFQEFKGLAEARLRNFVSFRNAAKSLEVALMFNARMLLYYVHTLIYRNLSAFLEARSLEVLSTECLEYLTSYYKVMPHTNEIKANSELAAEVAVVAKEYAAALEKESSAKKVKLGSKQKKKPLTDSACSSSDTMNPPSELPITPVQKPNETQVEANSPSSAAGCIQSVQRRLKIITENAHTSLPSDVFTLLGQSKDYPELNSSPCAIPSQKSSPDGLPKKFTRLSQRERKRLTSTSSTGDESSSYGVASPPQSPWAAIPPVDDASPKSEEDLPRIDAIILEEKEERKRIAMVKNKPLDLTLMEDRAIRELEIFYNVAEATEERITVQRLSATDQVPTPVWPPQSNVARALW